MSSFCCGVYPTHEYDSACNLTLFDAQLRPNAISLLGSIAYEFDGGFVIQSQNKKILVSDTSTITLNEVETFITNCNS